MPDRSLVTHGDIDHVFELASITKLQTAMAVLVAIEEGTLDYDTPVAGTTICDLLAHSGGISADDTEAIAAPRTRRIYSTAAYELLADSLATASGLPFSTYVREAVFEPLGMSHSTLEGSAGAGGWGSVRDLVLLSASWWAPMLISQETLTRATTPHLPDLDGVLPGYGGQKPNPWGLGPEIRGSKTPHWTGDRNSPQTFGHFGRSGTMMWIDPTARATLIVLTDTPFDYWAIDAWPALSDAVLSSAQGA